jgi:hypothetical protein
MPLYKFYVQLHYITYIPAGFLHEISCVCNLVIGVIVCPFCVGGVKEGVWWWELEFRSVIYFVYVVASFLVSLFPLLLAAATYGV